MKRLAIWIIPIVFGLLVGPGQDAAAQSETASTPINLVGDWKTVDIELEMVDGQMFDDDTFVEGRLTITKQTGAIVNAKYDFKLKTASGHDGEMAVTERSVDMLGVISWSNDEIMLMSHGEKDSWIFNGKIVDPRTIELVAYEMGEHGWVARTMARRQ
jgi:hypothetical protein